MRAEKTLSLNLKVRQEERTQLDKERLERANQRLIAEGLPAGEDGRGTGQRRWR